MQYSKFQFVPYLQPQLLPLYNWHLFRFRDRSIEASMYQAANVTRGHFINYTLGKKKNVLWSYSKDHSFKCTWYIFSFLYGHLLTVFYAQVTKPVYLSNKLSSSLKSKLFLYTLNTFPPKIHLNLHLQQKVKTWDLTTVSTWIKQVFPHTTAIDFALRPFKVWFSCLKRPSFWHNTN